MKKEYNAPTIETVQLTRQHLMTITGSETNQKVRNLDTKALQGETQTEENTLTSEDTFL